LAHRGRRVFLLAFDALQIAGELKQRQACLRLFDPGEDMSNGLSKLTFTIASGFAEADRARESVQASKNDCPVRGKFLGGAVQWGGKLAAAAKRSRPTPPWRS
jgi:putative DNA-invertase from lambdoid prophage Rac